METLGGVYNLKGGESDEEGLVEGCKLSREEVKELMWLVERLMEE